MLAYHLVYGRVGCVRRGATCSLMYCSMFCDACQRRFYHDAPCLCSFCCCSLAARIVVFMRLLYVPTSVSCVSSHAFFVLAWSAGWTMTYLRCSGAWIFLILCVCFLLPICLGCISMGFVCHLLAAMLLDIAKPVLEFGITLFATCLTAWQCS